MKIYIDIDTGKVSRGAGGATSLIFYLRDILNPLELVFLQDAQPVTSTVLAASALHIGLKSSPDGTLLAGSTDHTLVGEVASVEFSLNTSELIDYFTAAVPRGTREAPFIFEVSVVKNDNSGSETLMQEPAIVRRDVYQASDSDPTSVISGTLLVVPGVTSYAQARAVTTLGRTLPTLFFFYISGMWESWTLRAKAESGEDDDGVSFLEPDDYDADDNNVTLVKSAIQ